MFRKRIYRHIGLLARLEVRNTLCRRLNAHASPCGILGDTYSSEHGHVKSIRVVKVESICVSKRDLFLGMMFVETVLLDSEHMIKQALSSKCHTCDRITMVGTDPNDFTICLAT